MPTKQLNQVLSAAGLPAHDGNAEISNLGQDTRRLEPGAAFVAIPGFTVDGHDFLEAALERGASALIVQDDRQSIWQPIADAHADIPLISVPDTRAALPKLAAAFHDYPAGKLTIVGVTGTDGKSTTTYLIHAMLSAAGHRTGMLSGVEFHVGGEWSRNESGETTPEADLIQERLAAMVASGDTHAVLEVSSHALELHRVDQITPQVAVFTGLADDHLDFHETREQYLAAKLKLFESLADPGAAVVRADDEHLEVVASAHDQRTIRVATNSQIPSDVSVIATAQDARGSEVRVVTPSGSLAARLPLPGGYNVSNAALAAGAAWRLDVRPAAMQAALNNLRPVPGRMESIDSGQPFTVIVDAAATGPALELALQTLKPHVAGRLILVFGVAGERDPLRKSSMAQAAAELADHTVITNENPRSEDPIAMVDEIAAHFEAAGGKSHDREPDRRTAIARALSLANEEDLVLIAGKGAEPTMIYADRVEQWDDREVARELLGNLPTGQLSP